MMFYIYAYIRARKSKNGKAGEPYYIGKGQGNRAYVKHGRIPVPKDKSKIVFMERNLTELGAFALERRYIRWYGRIDIGTGILRNLTDGGDGWSGAKHSLESKRKISESKKGTLSPWVTEYNRTRVHPFLGKKRPDHSKIITQKNIETWNTISDIERAERSKNIGNGVRTYAQQNQDEIMKRAKKSAEGNRGKFWWNNGTTEIKSKESPGLQWKRGRIKRASSQLI